LSPSVLWQITEDAIFSFIADFVVFGLLGLGEGTKLASSLHFFIEDTLKIYFLLITMIYAVAFMRSFMSPERARAWLAGKSRFVGYALAAFFGVITPFCSCSSVPLFIAFLSAGIPLGVTMTFLITSPLVNEVAVILLGEWWGFGFMGVYVGRGVVLGMIGGGVVDTLKLEKWVEPFVWDIKMPVPEMLEERQGWRWREKFARSEALSIFKKVWVYVLIGVGVGAALHGYVPKEWFIAHAGADNPFAVPLAVIAGIPLYSNATGIIPVASVLMDKGVPVGTILAFIMSIVAISLPEIMILKKVLKVQMIAFFIAFLVVAFTCVGYLFNFLFSGGI